MAPSSSRMLLRTYVRSPRVGFLQDDRHPGLEPRGLDPGDEPHLESGNQALLEAWDFLGGAIARDHHLLCLGDQGVEGVEELLLRPFLGRDKLHVVDDQHVRRAEVPTEPVHVAFLNRPDEVVREGLAGEVGDSETRGLRQTVDGGVEEMSLSQSHFPIDEERVVGAPGGFRYAQAGSVGKSIRGTDHEVGKRVVALDGG